jgi:hypothetical protein
MVGSEKPLVSLSTNTTQLQETAKTKNGATVTISISFGTTLKGSEWVVACENGVVSVAQSKVK